MFIFKGDPQDTSSFQSKFNKHLKKEEERETAAIKETHLLNLNENNDSTKNSNSGCITLVCELHTIEEWVDDCHIIKTWCRLEMPYGRVFQYNTRL